MLRQSPSYGIRAKLPHPKFNHGEWLGYFDGGVAKEKAVAAESLNRFFFENGQRHFQPQQLEAINPTFYPPKRLLVYRNLNPRHLFLASEQIFEKNVKILDALPIHCLFRSLDQHQLIHFYS